MFGSFHLLDVRGVPVKIHLTALFLLPFILRSSNSLLFGLIAFVMILLSVALHELGHTIVAQRYGITVQDIVLTPIGGVARLKGLPENPHHEIRIALAGPYVSLFLALCGALLLRLGFHRLPLFFNTVFLYFALLNLMLFLFNLLPCFPMDGGRVFRAWLSLKKGALEGTRIAADMGKYISIFFIVIGLAYGHFPLMLIGGFMLISGGSEYRMMKLKAWQSQTYGQASETPVSKPDFVAGPPPYEKSQRPAHPPGFLNDLRVTATDLVAEIKSSLLNL
jgi:Zn-dependent protease